VRLVLFAGGLEMGRFVDGLIRRLLMSPKRFCRILICRILTDIEKSEAHAELCTRVYGKNLGQFNAATMLQLEKVISVLSVSSGQTLHDVGCGAGLITEYLVEVIGANAVGFDFAADAVRIASVRNEQRGKRVRFEPLDLNTGELPGCSADAIVAIDSL
jgi:cyclopropane fatty-acyl-phospholipid synthase-like methyltransferase